MCVFGYTEYAYIADRGSQDRRDDLVVVISTSSSGKGAQVLRPTGSGGWAASSSSSSSNIGRLIHTKSRSRGYGYDGRMVIVCGGEGKGDLIACAGDDAFYGDLTTYHDYF